MKKEKYAEDVQNRLREYAFEINLLKKHLEKKGLGSNEIWIKEFNSLREREEEIKFHLYFIKRKKNIIIRNIAKLHIELLFKEARGDFRRIAKEYDYRPLTDDAWFE